MNVAKRYPCLRGGQIISVGEDDTGLLVNGSGEEQMEAETPPPGGW